ncbi:uncharacterized protein LOC144909943 [Branchiostoma floridae x Branchiostoma belcheri]
MLPAIFSVSLLLVITSAAAGPPTTFVWPTKTTSPTLPTKTTSPTLPTKTTSPTLPTKTTSPTTAQTPTQATAAPALKSGMPTERTTWPTSTYVYPTVCLCGLCYPVGDIWKKPRCSSPMTTTTPMTLPPITTDIVPPITTSTLPTLHVTLPPITTGTVLPITTGTVPPITTGTVLPITTSTLQALPITTSTLQVLPITTDTVPTLHVTLPTITTGYTPPPITTTNTYTNPTFTTPPLPCLLRGLKFNCVDPPCVDNTAYNSFACSCGTCPTGPNCYAWDGSIIPAGEPVAVDGACVSAGGRRGGTGSPRTQPVLLVRGASSRADGQRPRRSQNKLSLMQICRFCFLCVFLKGCDNLLYSGGIFVRAR